MSSWKIKKCDSNNTNILWSGSQFHKSYKRSPSEHKTMEKDVEKYLKMEVIEPCFGPWSAPALYAPKKTGELRFCI
jgi:glycerate kinase